MRDLTFESLEVIDTLQDILLQNAVPGDGPQRMLFETAPVSNPCLSISIWKQAIIPKKWREHFPGTKIALLFMALMWIPHICYSNY